ncbi:hypothetical protein I541_5667 [Mycobacteroides abscessus]|nr:hypothetical protein I541_5667 [Mycobacteroides abscessus]
MASPTSRTRALVEYLDVLDQPVPSGGRGLGRTRGEVAENWRRARSALAHPTSRRFAYPLGA